MANARWLDPCEWAVATGRLVGHVDRCSILTFLSGLRRPRLVSSVPGLSHIKHRPPPGLRAAATAAQTSRTSEIGQCRRWFARSSSAGITTEKGFAPEHALRLHQRICSTSKRGNSNAIHC